jgi:hypothetical protein
LKALVVHIPPRAVLLGEEGDVQRDAGILFARKLGATFVDGAEAFAGLDAEEVRRCFLPYDGHWNQEGSDRFAGFMRAQIRTHFISN